MVLQSLSWLGEMAWVELEPGEAQREHRAEPPEPPEAPEEGLSNGMAV
jgi:hypothetical protein